MTISQRSAVFVFISFGLSWAAAITAWRSGMTGLGNNDQPAVFYLFPFGPAIAAMVCARAFDRARFKTLGFRLRPNIWWVVALLLPLALGMIAALGNIIISGSNPLSSQSWAAAIAALTDNAMATNFPNPWAALLAASLIALVTEEIGWRGYLYHLWRGFGFWRYSVAVGVLWGLWHLPMVILFGIASEYAVPLAVLNYVAGLTILAAYCTLIRDRADSVIAVAIFHGAWNTFSNHGPGYYVVMAAMLIGLGFVAWRQRLAYVEVAGKRAQVATDQPLR